MPPSRSLPATNAADRACGSRSDDPLLGEFARLNHQLRCLRDEIRDLATAIFELIAKVDERTERSS